MLKEGVLKRKFANRLKKIREEHRVSNVIIVYSLFSIDLLTGFIRLLFSSSYKIKFTSCGKYFILKGKPYIRIKGKAHVGDFCDLTSTHTKLKIIVEPEGKLLIGDDVRINGAHISVSHSIKIGNQVSISPYCLLLDNDYHSIYNNRERGKKKGIVIDDKAWIASKATILKGVHIGEGAVITSGSVVISDIPSHCLAGGVPARVIKKIRNK